MVLYSKHDCWRGLYDYQNKTHNKFLLCLFLFNHGLAWAQQISPLLLSDPDGSNGLVFHGVSGGDRSVERVSSAGDGVVNLLVAATTANPGGNTSADSRYVVFGVERAVFKNGFE
ncbi:MAG: hypothetical protein DWP95_06105 [Proteobacteria bacterium]|nr:MAG: hypothetical protein DWP95_06105 [Pseudomonadota bacterium]